MRKPITLTGGFASVAALVGPGCRAYVYGSVAKGIAGPDSDLDIYVAGPCAEKLESRYFMDRPRVTYAGREYPAHIIGALMVSEADFLAAQPEAIRVR